jgi:hypothetical protein
MGRPSVNRVVQIGVESTPGTAVACTKSLPTTNIELTRQTDTKQYRAMGYKTQTIAKIVKDWCQGKMDGPFNFTEIVYPLSTLVTPVITTPTNGLLTRKWVFTPKARGADAFKTLTVQEGDDTAALQAAYAVFTEFGVDLKLDDATLSGSLIAQNLTSTSLTNTLNEIQSFIKTGTVSGGTFTLTYSGQTTGNIPYNATADDVHGFLSALTNIAATDIIVSGGPLPSTAVTVEFTGTLAGTNVAAITVDNTNVTGGGTIVASTTQSGGGTGVTTVDQVPIGPREIDVYMDPAVGGTIGTTKVADALSASFKIGNKYGPKWVLNTTYPSFREAIETVPTLDAEFTTEFNAQARTLFSSITATANPVQLVRLKATGALIESVTPDYYYSITLDFAAQVIATEASDTDGTYAYNFKLLPEYSSVFGNRAWELTLQTTLTSL